MTAKFTLDAEATLKFLKSPDGPAWFALKRASDRVRQEAKSRAPVDQGGLRASIASEMRDEDGPVAYVGSTLPYAVYVHEGTGIYSKKNPRPIRPVRAKALRWAKKNQSGRGNRRYKGGKTSAYVFSKQSAGSPGRPFLVDALKAVLGRVQS